MASGPLWSRRRLVLGGVGAAAVSLAARGIGHGDSGAVTAEGRRPRWPVRSGDILRYRRPDGRVIHVGVAAVHPPDEVYDYLRVAVVAIDGPRVPMRLDLAAALADDPSYVPVGRAAEPMGMAATWHAADVIRAGRAIITLGYAVIVPDGDGADDEPAAAGFAADRVDDAIPEMNGYAVLLTWSQLAGVLDVVTLPTA